MLKYLALRFCCSSDDNEQTLIFYSPGDKCLALDADRSSANPDVVSHGVQRGPLELAAGESLTLHIFVDRSVCRGPLRTIGNASPNGSIPLDRIVEVCSFFARGGGECETKVNGCMGYGSDLVAMNRTFSMSASLFAICHR